LPPPDDLLANSPKEHLNDFGYYGRRHWTADFDSPLLDFVPRRFLTHLQCKELALRGQSLVDA
jgi:hypothetical protein